jgi:hypothetical protein
MKNFLRDGYPESPDEDWWAPGHNVPKKIATPQPAWGRNPREK